MRISGLVRYYNQVRERLKGGIPEDDRREFLEGVRQVLFRVEELCESHPAGPDCLPGPSRRAYRFLRELDLEDLPSPRPGVPVARSPMRIAGLVAIADRVADELWRKLDDLQFLDGDEDLRGFTEDIKAHVGAVEDICSETDADPSALAPRSRRAYAWLKFLLTEGTLSWHVRALVRAREAARRARCVRVTWDRVYLSFISGLYRSRTVRGARILTCSEGFIEAPPEVWEAILSVATGENAPGARRRAREYSTTDAYSLVTCELASMIRPKSSAHGVHHDLDAAFHRVNKAYFGGDMPRPNLEWSAVPSGRKMGHYQYAGDVILISVTLDDPEVPAFVVDFVLFHELLHKMLGVRWVNGRISAHDAEFRALERKFERFKEAEALIRVLCRR